MYDAKTVPEEILPVLELFMITLESEFNHNKDIYNSLEMDYGGDALDDQVLSIYRRVTNASVDYAELKFQLKKLSQ